MILHWANRIGAIAVWGYHVLHWYQADGGVALVKGAIFFSGVALIWFAEAFGDAAGFSVTRSPGIDPVLDIFLTRRMWVTRPSAGWAFVVLGWVVLTGPWWLAFLTQPVLLPRS